MDSMCCLQDTAERENSSTPGRDIRMLGWKSVCFHLQSCKKQAKMTKEWKSRKSLCSRNLRHAKFASSPHPTLVGSQGVQSLESMFCRHGVFSRLDDISEGSKPGVVCPRKRGENTTQHILDLRRASDDGSAIGVPYSLGAGAGVILVTK